MKTKLKYGENPHQRATVSLRESNDPLAIRRFRRSDGSPFVGDDTSWISIVDVGRLLQVVERFAASFRKNVRTALPQMAVIVKHGSPCGAAFGGDSADVAKNAWLGDREAAFGGFLAATFPFTRKVVAALLAANAGKMPFLSVAASALETEIEAHIGSKAHTRYFIANPALAKIPDRMSSEREVKSVRDLLLEQEPFQFVPDFAHMEQHGAALPGKEKPRVFADLSLAYAVCSSSTSNTVSIVRDGVLIGNAVGQQKRIGSAKLAVQLAKENGHDTKDAVAATDSYFPFPDGLEVLAKVGVRTIFATSGSIRDDDVFNAAEKLGISLYTVPDKVGRMFAGH